MPKGYWIVSLEPTDAARLRAYAERVRPVVAALGGTFLARGGAHEAPEGSARPLNVIVEFPDYATALAAYRAPEYAEIIGDRLAGARGDFVVVEGV